MGIFNQAVKMRLHHMIDSKEENLTERDIEAFCTKEDVSYRIVDHYLSSLAVPEGCRMCENVSLFPSVPPCTSCMRARQTDYFTLSKELTKAKIVYEVRVRDDPDVKVPGLPYYVWDTFPDHDYAINSAKGILKAKQNKAKPYVMKIYYDSYGNLLLEELIWAGYHPHAGETTVFKEKDNE